jgi:hypothetical protein
MFHPSIIAQYTYRRVECQALAVDASSLAQCLRSLGIDANRLALL